MKVKKAIIPAAGLGTRVLPASKAVPKEMLPLAYSSVIITDAAQLGIRPTRADANGCRNPMPFKNADTLS